MKQVIFHVAINYHLARPIIILQTDPQNKMVSYTSGHQGDKMIFIIVILMLFFILGSLSPLLVTDDVQDIVMMKRS